ncbi:MAG: hypothetical protein KME19_04055 [Microcoleus vaginatus WJT46-NPBG5]|jgi:hypothetical protein|nr:hypothetical protein [Microcoleus vaginatus WJT46-NPBG5]
MNVLMDVSVGTGAESFPLSFTLVYVVGFIAAVTIGSVAWYNSKRPTGWEDKERPDIVPKVKKEETPGIGEPKR